MADFLYQWIDQFNKNVDNAVELLTGISKAQDNDPVSDDISNELTMNPAETIFPGVWGGDGNDTLTGGAGDDDLFGESANDILDGGRGRDYLHGGDGNDILIGREGDDTLIGAEGNDTLTGGPGADNFSMSRGKDIVTDFRVDEGDTISFLGGGGAFTIYEYDAHVTVTWLYNGQMQIQGATGLDVYRSFSDRDLGMLEATNFDVPA